ncbi:MAG: pyridoxal-phosphate dependent enzyme, partial [Clostridia bacterium]|nr:pyridoxal-phosphate dependent enzyme [Clostridia bacterium]
MSALNIGNTPLIQLNIAAPASLFAKVEGGNPGGSIKDRVALAIIEDAEEKGVLKTGGLVVEATSGNTGIGLSLVCKAKGYRAVIVMPDSMSKERRELIKSYGGEVVLTDGAKGMQGAVEKAKEIVKNSDNALLADQFNNPVCAKVHYEST